MEWNKIADDLAIEKPYTFADAMREGAEITPQVFRSLYTNQGATCALGAAMVGLRMRGLV